MYDPTQKNIEIKTFCVGFGDFLRYDGGFHRILKCTKIGYGNKPGNIRVFDTKVSHHLALISMCSIP